MNWKEALVLLIAERGTKSAEETERQNAIRQAIDDFTVFIVSEDGRTAMQILQMTILQIEILNETLSGEQYKSVRLVGNNGSGEFFYGNISIGTEEAVKRFVARNNCHPSRFVPFIRDEIEKIVSRIFLEHQQRQVPQ